MSVLTYNASQQVRAMEGCAAMMFTNVGDTDVSVNGMILHAAINPATTLGDSRTIGISDSEECVYIGNITIAFANPGGVAPKIEVVQLFFT